MQKHQIRSHADALIYLTDCTLATVCDLASKKSRSKHEFERQIVMAQLGVDWVGTMTECQNTRVKEVMEFGGSVREWATQFYPK